jgi:hypothetical protein
VTDHVRLPYKLAERSRILLYIALGISTFACSTATRVEDSGSKKPQNGHTVYAPPDPAVPQVPTASGEKPYELPLGESVAHLVGTPDGAQRFFNFTRTRFWYGWERERKCKKNCVVPNKTRVVAEAIEGANEISSDPKAPAVGFDRVLGRVIGQEKGEDDLYDACTPTDTSDVECYRYLVANSLTERLIILTIDESSSTPSYRLSTPVNVGTLRHCGTVHSAKYADADFSVCDPPIPLTSSTSVIPPISSKHHRDPATSPFWMACNEGCCS